MMKKFGTALVALALAGAPYGGGMYVAAATEPSIDVDAISTAKCGEQSMTFSGTAVFDQNIDHLQVKLDGAVILHYKNSTSDTPEAWSTPSQTVGVGDHTLMVTMFDLYNGSTNDVLAGPVVENFTVTACGGEPADTGGDAGSGGDSGDQGPEGDCCPGPDPNEAAARKPRVKGAVSTAGLPARLRPLNSIFNSVYGRNPTFEEWTYWADRLLNDKPQYDALYGAMQWHQLRGHSVGG